MPVDGTGLAGTRIAGLGSPATTGELRVRAERLGKHSVVTDAYRTAPFHLGLPSDRSGDGSIELIVQGVGPGCLPGDRLRIDISVGEGASLIVRGQGATKVFPSPQAIAVTVEVTLSIEPGGRLVYLPGELIPYRGGDPGEGSTMRDFRSTLTVEDKHSGEKFTDAAHMNHPIYFNAPGKVPGLGNMLPFQDSWLFFQAQYDPQQRWTVLGVGNRPGAWLMTVGSVMIFVGLIYAFYIKPVVIRRMKAKALAQAEAKKRPGTRTPELVDA